MEKSSLTVRMVLKMLALLAIIFVFCPSFLVSCSGTDIKVSAMDVAKGIEVYQQKVSDPYPIVLICLLIPIAILVLLFLKNREEKLIATTILGGAGVDFIFWIIFRTVVKNKVDENYYNFQTTIWFYLNMIVLIAIIGLTALIVINKLKMETDILKTSQGITDKIKKE